MQPSLFISTGRQQGTVIPLAGTPLTFGRSSGNQVQLLDREISRRHFEIFSESGSFWIRDLASNNGTYLNGSRVSFCQLKTGDQIRIGQTELLFTGAAADNAWDERAVFVHLVDDLPAGFQDSLAERVAAADALEASDTSRDSSGGRNSPYLFAAKVQADLEFVYRAFHTIGHTLNEQELFERVVEQIFEWVQADRACILLCDSVSQELIVTSARQRQVSSESRMRVNRSILDYVKTHNEGVLTHNARDDERWNPGDSSASLGIREAICVPLKGHHGFLGAIYVDTAASPNVTAHSARGKFTEEHLKIMLAIGNHAALAVESTRHYSALVNRERLAAIGQTIASLSHHIKNILQGIKSGTYLLESGLKNAHRDDTERGWAIVKKYQEHISSLVLDMLSFSRDREPTRELACLNTVITAAVELVLPRAKSLNIELHWEPNSTLAEFEFDPFGIGHAITNLLQNAVDACEHSQGGRVSISVGHNPAIETVFVVVQDNGVGIAGPDLPKLFELFHSTKGGRGTGLGLAVSQKIVQEHGGKISVESQPGAGSRFSIAIPVKVQPIESSTSVRPHSPRSIWAAKPK